MPELAQEQAPEVLQEHAIVMFMCLGMGFRYVDGCDWASRSICVYLGSSGSNSQVVDCDEKDSG